MSTSFVLTPTPPTVSETALSMLAEIGVQNGVLTDYNVGSQIRTLSEAFGSIAEEEGYIIQALAFQAIVYSGFAAFGVTPLPAAQATGTVTFTTANSVPATFNIIIQAGTLLQTTAGTRFQTLSGVTLAQSTTSVLANVIAVNAGVGGNVSSGAITTLISQPPYPLTVSNGAATTGGTNAETPQQTLARFTATVGALGLASPVAIANSAVGVQAPSSSETVQYATCYEAWIYQLQNNLTVTPGFQVVVDNGSGTASSALVAAVVAQLNGSYPDDPGNRPAGVPYSVSAVIPTTCTLVIAATLINTNNAVQLTALCQQAVQNYFASLQFNQPAQQSAITAAVGAVLEGYITSLTVTLKDSTNTTQSVITPAAPPAIPSRMLLTGYTSSIM